MAVLIIRLHAYIRGSGCRIHLTPCIAAFSIQYTGVSAHAGVSTNQLFQDLAYISGQAGRRG